ncbi:lipoyl(octanoyl) transferase LipB [Wolbachia endosymbiont of Dirofilaria (Dirofilaria) immitis]|uniref:lipoyl(octanoyl) transferase LipB n=1 Tax=Wolbachia endosymbiont of Dirofilaria (Dirofilaria) immitis TaxID=1812115 RepID=UPI00158E31B7|nr:lipoyl(octanoyl) transferase LipB [Wolbachia endosymbiont of Dirofilaria (Dirofilaria) immitis]QKX02597.1 lipoyl(octanoyl) transferase LipB [Wolbachia endosymbiont of Dirofilaria (Dirofilaria) immitis]
MVEWLISNQLIDYKYAVKFMEAKVQEIYNNLSDELVWLLQHPSLYTAGISATDDEIVEELFPIHKTSRGGKYTYHGPGQRIIYLMLNLKKRNKCDIKLYIRDISNWIINVLMYFNIFGKFKEDRIGVWVTNTGVEEKIAAFGIRLRKWVTYHGIALNVSLDLSHYKGIIPCGLKDYGVTSMKELGVEAPLSELDDILKKEFYKIF